MVGNEPGSLVHCKLNPAKLMNAGGGRQAIFAGKS
jgi:hypothetical protein